MHRSLSRRLAFLMLCCAANLKGNPSCADGKRLYHWTILKFTPYTTASFKLMPQGDMDARRAFYWGWVIGADGMAFTIRQWLPHLEEGSWQEPVYRSEKEKREVFERLRKAQQLYASYGCGDNFLHVTAHHILDPQQSREQWREAVLTGMGQRAELLKYAGIRRIIIDTEYLKWVRVTSDMNFWNLLGCEIIQRMGEVYPQIEVGFYPGLYNYWATLSPREMPKEFSFSRHALLKGMYDHRDQCKVWTWEAWLYGPGHLCKETAEATYFWNVEEHIQEILKAHHALLGPDIEFMFARWDIGSSQPKPVKKNFKQPNISLTVAKRNYELFFRYCDLLGFWDDFNAWDEDSSYYLSFPNEQSFSEWKQQVAGITLSSPRCYDAVTKQQHVVLCDSPDIEDKLKFYTVYRNPQGEVHVAANLCSDFPAYVQAIREAAGKDRTTIPLKNAQEIT